MPNNVASDTSFLICLACDLAQRSALIEFLDCYDFFIGLRILSEMPPTIREDKDILNHLNLIEIDYYELFKPLFTRAANHLDDGEYEAIGIAYWLVEDNRLDYLIIDDRRPYNFVTANFPKLSAKMTGSLGFIKASCLTDKLIAINKALSILNSLLTSVETSERRPCGIDKNKGKALLKETIREIESSG